MQCLLVLVVIIFVLAIVFYFQYCSKNCLKFVIWLMIYSHYTIWSYIFWHTSNSRCDLLPWWITYLDPTIYQDLSIYIKLLDHLELHPDLLTSTISTRKEKHAFTIKKKRYMLILRSWKLSLATFSPLSLLVFFYSSSRSFFL